MNDTLLAQDETVQTLVKLGLTVLQAKVYLSLAKFGTSTGRTTAKAAKVASQDVYRVLTELQEKGLVEKVIAKPTMYKAISINEGLSILLQNKKEEYKKTQEEVETICNSFAEGKEVNEPHECFQFIITSHYKLLVKLHEKLANAAKESIDFITPLKLNEKTLLQACPYIKPALKRGVKLRVITHKEVETTVDNPNFPSDNPLFEYKFLTENTIPFGMHIFDKHEVTLAISKQATPSLWTNNPHVVELAETYFNNIWTKMKRTTDAITIDGIQV